MSELIQKNDNRATIRWKLLTGASALALTAYVSSAGMAQADDSSTPQVWITLGGQMEMLNGESSPFTAPFMTALTPTPGPYKGGIFKQNQLHYAFGLDGKLSFQPEDSDWIFSAGIRYGRSHSHRHVHRQTQIPPYHLTLKTLFGYPVTKSGAPYPLRVTDKPAFAPFADVKAPMGEKHTILDFTAGKDVGLGLWGSGRTSVVSGGVRSAEFSSDTGLDVQARPLITPYFLPWFYLGKIPFQFTWDQYAQTGHAERSFRGIGPTISWEASAALAGNPDHGELTLDWGIDAAALFGRQRAKVSHSTQQAHYTVGGFGGTSYHVVYHHPPGTGAYHSTRSRNVTVPNIGGSIGLSVKYTNLKLSIGYRYETFLNAMDTGIDTRKTSNTTFQGPYASISVGIGD